MAGKSDASGSDPDALHRFIAYSGYPAGEPRLLPPVHVRFDFMVVGVRWTEETIARTLPPELHPAPGNAGLAYTFVTRGPAPQNQSTACFLAIEVEGFTSPDGSSAHHVVGGYYSGPIGRMMRHEMNANFGDGLSQISSVGDVLVGTGGGADGPAMRIALRPTQPVRGDAQGIHSFIGTDPHGGGLAIYPVAFTGQIGNAEPLACEILPGATATMRAMQPAELLWGLWAPGLDITYGEARPIADVEANRRDMTRTLLIEIVAQLGRPALLVSRGAHVLLKSRAVTEMEAAGAFRAAEVLRFHRASDQAALCSLIESAIDGRLDLAPIAIDGPDHRPLLVQALPVPAAVAGQPAALVLLTDPAAPPMIAPHRALQLLGLTPGEARIAALIGAGLTPRMAAEQLGITLNTVRSTLKLVFDKLGIARQSQLATLVARLGTSVQ